MRNSWLFALILLGVSVVSGGAQASGHIYLLRGLAGIFSTGLDVLDEKLVQRGYSATVDRFLQLPRARGGPFAKKRQGANHHYGTFARRRRRHLHGGEDEDSRGFGCSDCHVRPDDEFSGTVKRGTSYQLLYGYHSCH